MGASLQTTNDATITELEGIRNRFEAWQNEIKEFGYQHKVKPVIRRVWGNTWRVVGVEEAGGTGDLEGQWNTPSKGIIYPSWKSEMEARLHAMNYSEEYCSTLPTYVRVPVGDGRTTKKVFVKPILQGDTAYVDIPDGEPDRDWDHRIWKNIVKRSRKKADDDVDDIEPDDDELDDDDDLSEVDLG